MNVWRRSDGRLWSRCPVCETAYPIALRHLCPEGGRRLLEVQLRRALEAYDKEAARAAKEALDAFDRGTNGTAPPTAAT